MAGKRYRENDGSFTYVISPTISEGLQRLIRSVSIESGHPMTAVTRVAIKIGLMRMAQALKKRDEGDPTVWDAIQKEIGTDGRKNKRTSKKQCSTAEGNVDG